MTQPWKKNLSQSQINLMQEIIDQVPTAGGGQGLFVDVLNTIGGQDVAPKYRYYIADCSGGDVRCTNDEDVANEHAQDEDNFVVDVQDNTWIQADLDAVKIVETNW